MHSVGPPLRSLSFVAELRNALASRPIGIHRWTPRRQSTPLQPRPFLTRNVHFARSRCAGHGHGHGHGHALQGIIMSSPQTAATAAEGTSKGQNEMSWKRNGRRKRPHGPLAALYYRKAVFERRYSKGGRREWNKKPLPLVVLVRLLRRVAGTRANRAAEPPARDRRNCPCVRVEETTLTK
jgi:hypothetical protein